MASEAVLRNAESFFRNLNAKQMSSAERAVYDLKIEREALLRNANAYARALNQIERYHVECSTRLEARHLNGRRHLDKLNKQAAAHQRELAKLNSNFPLGFARDELRAINVEIAKAVTELQRSWLDDRKPNERFSTFRINSGGVN
jgi:hypothetical protein